ncbi:MAG TPA: hypothetical protein VF544_12775 [Pyrinomonadaceae bacterium]|jgi:hypothetical protein
MKDTITRRLDTFIRVRQFGSSYAAAFTAGSRGREVLDDLNEVITEMEDHAAAQSSGKRAAKESTNLKAAAFAALREDLEAIRRTARAMALTMPGFEDKFRLPVNSGEQEWLATARAIAADAAPFKTEFIRRGLPANFLEDFNASIEAFEQTINDKAQKKGARVAVTVKLDEATARGINDLRELDAIVRNVFRNNPAVLAEWTSASHTERPSRRAKAVKTPVTPEPEENR